MRIMISGTIEGSTSSFENNMSAAEKSRIAGIDRTLSDLSSRAHDLKGHKLSLRERFSDQAKKLNGARWICARQAIKWLI